ncbi:hypothetical protein EV360DRAFT_66007 [Lentinula raphanica]|nr:hypothetical protein EV360DRAFT_66007 [Lentinula raphanica]
MKPVTEVMQAAITHLQSRPQYGQRIEEDAEAVRATLVEDETLVDNRLTIKQRKEVMAWMACNSCRRDMQSTYPDKGVVDEVLKALVLNLSYGAEKAVADIVDMFETMQTELNITEPMLRSRNGGVGDITQGVMDEENVNQELNDLSDLSDLTELSDDVESQDGDALNVEAKEDGMTRMEQPRQDNVKNTPPRRLQERKINKAEQLAQEEETVNKQGKAYLSSISQTQKWRRILEKIVGIPEKVDVPEAVTANVVAVIREMKKVGKGTYSTPEFRRALKLDDIYQEQETGVTAIIEEISDPVFKLLNRNPRMLWLEHVYRIGDQLAEVLDKWTPLEIRKTWGTEPTHFVSETNGKPMITTPKEFIDVFIIHHRYVPGEENLSFCFFLTSLENFIYHYDRWLGKLLVKLGYDVSNFNDVQKLQKFYPWLMSQIHEWCTQDQLTSEGKRMKVIDVKTFKNERWRTIIKKTWWLRQLRKQSEKHAQELIHCQECLEMQGSEQCCQYVYKPHITQGLSPSARMERMKILRQELRGAGVTMVPEKEQIKCRQDDIGRPQKDVKMYHPDSVGDTNPVKLDGLVPDMGIVKRCGHQLMIMLEEEDISDEDKHKVDWRTINEKEIIDIVWWRPFDDEKLALLQDTIVESTGVQALKRGDQFRSFGGGKMIPVGARSPAGGREGDAYTSYAGLEASTQHGLEILFNQAATSVIMLGAAKMVFPKLANRLRDLSIECDRIGMTGANIYNCTGYMVPIHQDRDETRGLCVQALLSADTAYKEYAFCNVEYQYYITTTTNCMWSFNSDNLHGTMLPSTKTIKNLNSHAIDPTRIPFIGPASGTGHITAMTSTDHEGSQSVEAPHGTDSIQGMAGGTGTQWPARGGDNSPQGRRGRGRGSRGSRGRGRGGNGVDVAGAPQAEGVAGEGNANQRRGRVTRTVDGGHSTDYEVRTGVVETVLQRDGTRDLVAIPGNGYFPHKLFGISLHLSTTFYHNLNCQPTRTTRTTTKTPGWPGENEKDKKEEERTRETPSNPPTPSRPGFHLPSTRKPNRDSTMSNFSTSSAASTRSTSSLKSNRPAPPSPAMSRRTSGVGANAAAFPVAKRFSSTDQGVQGPGALEHSHSLRNSATFSTRNQSTSPKAALPMSANPHWFSSPAFRRDSSTMSVPAPLPLTPIPGSATLPPGANSLFSAGLSSAGLASAVLSSVALRTAATTASTAHTKGKATSIASQSQIRKPVRIRDYASAPEDCVRGPSLADASALALWENDARSLGLGVDGKGLQVPTPYRIKVLKKALLPSTNISGITANLNAMYTMWKALYKRVRKERKAAAKRKAKEAKRERA